MAQIKQVQIGADYYDLENRYIEITGASGTLTDAQLGILQASDNNFIIANGIMLKLVSKSASRLGYQAITAGTTSSNHCIITISTKNYTITSDTLATQSYVDNAISGAVDDAIADSY